MKPLNLDNKPCSPISSNCVVWQGPDISCIALCTGDTVSDVVHAMATELCTILDTLKVSNYDLTCFNLQACGPEDFQALIQFLIDRICELEGVTPETKEESACPDCVVSVADCFITGSQTTMQLVDYVQLIGERVCSIIRELDLINNQITNIDNRVTILENAPIPTFTLPRIAVDCDLSPTILSGGSYPIDDILSALINDNTYGYCALISATGLPADILSAVASQEPCITETTNNIVKGTRYGDEAGWVDSPVTVADSITNIWIVLCDLYTALANASQSITVADTNTINLELNAADQLTAKIKDTGWVDLLGFDWYTNSMTSAGVKPQCRRMGNAIHFRGIVYVPLRKSAGDQTVSTLDSTQAYYNVTDVTPAQSGAGSVQVFGSSSILFNQGNSSIPTAIVGSQAVDAKYRMPYPGVVSRNISVGGESVLLTGAGRLGIQANGTLYFAALTDQEFASGLSTNYPANSALRYITSNVRAGDFIPNYADTTADIHSFPVPAAYSPTAAYTVGDIVQFGGAYYQSFVNVTGGGNPDVTDTNWDPYKSKVDVAFHSGQPTWPFNCDAGDASQLGGFFTSIEGLVAFIDCDNDAALAPNLDCNDPRP